MYKASESAAFSKEVALQFFIHQQATREKSLNWSSVVDPEVSTVHSIHSQAHNHRQFRTFITEMESEICYLPYHSAVSW